MSKKIKAKCFMCDTVGYIPEDYTGKIRCPKCGNKIIRTARPLSEIRKQLLERLDSIADAGIKKVKWIGGDEHSCEVCKDRGGEVFTIDEMRNILLSDFCQSDHFEQTCRCCIGAYKEKQKPINNPKINISIKRIAED